jgi:hypothetical protein
MIMPIGLSHPVKKEWHRCERFPLQKMPFYDKKAGFYPIIIAM